MEARIFLPLILVWWDVGSVCDKAVRSELGDGLLNSSHLFTYPRFFLERWEFIGYHKERKTDKFIE